jgi:NHL repeat
LSGCPHAGILTSRIDAVVLPPSSPPDRDAQRLPADSGATVPDSHRLPAHANSADPSGSRLPASWRLQTFRISAPYAAAAVTSRLLCAAAAFALTAAGCGGANSVPPKVAVTPILPTLHTQTTIGSTVDPGPGTGTGDQNPYGLAIAPITAGKLTAGDLVACNFNDAANVQGNGTTIVALHPIAGATPTRIAQAASLQGCDALTLDANDNIYTADFVANDAPIFGPSGTLVSANANPAFSGPFGAIYSPTAGAYGSASVFESNATSGTVVRLDLKNGAVATSETIATGFTPNTGVPGSLLGPSGLAYDPNGDRLYVVDGGASRLVVFTGASSIPAGGIVVTSSGFTGPSAANASVVTANPAFKAPISAALLVNGDVVVGNTGDNNLLEFTRGGALVGMKNIDPTGATGAIFGIVASGTTAANQKIYVNDDNTNAVIVLSQ